MLKNEFCTRFAGRLTEAGQLIDSLFDVVDLETKAYGDIQHVSTESTTYVSGDTLQGGAYPSATPKPVAPQHTKHDMEVHQILRRFVEHVLCHSAVQAASNYDKMCLRQELRLFLLAHIEQIENNTHMFSQDSQHNSPAFYQNPNRTFFDWVRNTSSNQTSCPYSCAFALCLLGNGHDFFRTSNEKYLGQAAYRHLATLCRLYNDCGSLVRDRLEKNLNSLNFPNFHSAQNSEEDEMLKKRPFESSIFRAQVSSADCQ